MQQVGLRETRFAYPFSTILPQTIEMSRQACFQVGGVCQQYANSCVHSSLLVTDSSRLSQPLIRSCRTSLSLLSGCRAGSCTVQCNKPLRLVCYRGRGGSTGAVPNHLNPSIFYHQLHNSASWLFQSQGLMGATGCFCWHRVGLLCSHNQTPMPGVLTTGMP